MSKFCVIGFENSRGIQRRPLGAPIILCKAHHSNNIFGDMPQTTFEWYKKSLDKKVIKKWSQYNMRKHCNRNWSSTKNKDIFVCSDGTILYIVPAEEVDICFAEIKLKGKN
jgi:hypothetical protein